ncbi:MAG TPA: polymer-forming cytoskeletal protein [Polyangia bacterium]|jgi:cytoskeletal protein CcmA (bactofilin family)
MKTVIGPETRIAGPLSGKDDLEVHGTVDGPVRGEASVTIAAGARIGGEVRGRDVIVGGELGHPVFATGTVHLLATAVLTGDIEAPRVAIDEGAVFDGQIRMRKKAATTVTPPATPTTAHVAVPAAPVQAMPATRAIPELASPGRKPLIRKSS